MQDIRGCARPLHLDVRFKIRERFRAVHWRPHWHHGCFADQRLALAGANGCWLLETKRSKRAVEVGETPSRPDLLRGDGSNVSAVSRTGVAVVIAAVLVGVTALVSSGCPEEATGEDGGDLPPGVEPGQEDGGLDYAFCPTAIDVYGGGAVSFAGCGGEDAPLGADAGAGLSGGDGGYAQT